MREKVLMRYALPLALCLGVVAFASDGLALTGDLKNDPADVVKKYLSLDKNGARLEALSWETLKPYITWREEPVWGHAVVISDFEVVDDIKQWEVVSRLEVVIPVGFRVLGAIYWETAAFLPEPQVEQVRFRVKAVKGLWRIVDPMMPPHVSQKRMVNHVREAILQETDKVRIAKLVELRDDLKKAR